MTQASGIPNVVNLSGGLYRSATPTQIPEISLSDMKNFNIEDQGLETRQGLTQSNTTPFYPGCVQFGYSQTQRVHYLKASGGDYGPQSPQATTQSKWGMWFYAKEATATTERRDLFNFQDSSGNVLMELYFGLDNRLHCNLRPNSGESLQDVAEGAGGEQVLRTATTHLYGVSLINDTANSIEVTLYDWTGDVVAVTKNYSSSNWSTLDTLVVGCDENTTYPDTDWTNSANNAFYGYMGEVVIARDRPTDIVKYFTDMHRAPGRSVLDSQRVAHYPFQKDYADAFGNNPTFPSNIFRTGGGLSNYSVKDSAKYTSTSESRDVLHCTKSWHVDTYGVNSHIIAKTSSLASRYRSYLNAVGTDYTLTMDILPVKSGSGTFTLLEATTAGPKIQLSKQNNGKTLITYSHKFNSANTPSVTKSIDNNYVTKLSFQKRHQGTPASTFQMKIFQDTMLVATTQPTLTSSTTPATVGNLQLGTANVTSISTDFFVSGLALHNTNAGDTWGNLPQETLSNVTTYTETVSELSNSPSRLDIGFGSSLPGFSYNLPDSLQTFVTRESSSKIERTGETTGGFSIFDLHKFGSVKGLWLFTETTGYDSASGSSPHGLITNIRTASTTDNTDFIVQNNSSPIWIADRFTTAGLASTDHLDSIFETSADNVINFTPVNSNLGNRIFITRNTRMVDTNGNTFSLGDAYSYNNRLTGKMRGFIYGNSLYIHNENHYLRFNGNEIRPVEVITPSIPLSLSNDNTPSTGLNGTYKYSYTFVDKSGIESYPALPVSTTTFTGNISVSLDSKILAQSYLSKQVNTIRVYRNKGGTTSTTNLGRDADKALYQLKEIPLAAVIANASGTLFTDTAADSGLGKNPPQPGSADPMPPCKYSAIFRDTVLFTGNTLAPNHFYQSQGQTPELLDGFDEFLTEDGEQNTGVGVVGAGFIIFKDNSRVFVRNGIGGEKYEYHNGGCMSHDSLVTVGQRVIGLGANGFFMTDGHQYDDITSVRSDGRIISSIHFDVDTWSNATKRAAVATYHAPTERYICYVNSKYYVFDMRHKVWVKYEDMVGFPFVYDNDFYIYSRGWLYKEVSTQNYVGTTRVLHSVGSGGVGRVQIVSTTALPTTNDSGLPAYVGTTHYWTTSVSNTGTTFDVYLATTKNFTNASDFSLGIMNHFANTKFRQERTPNRNKMWKRLLAEHDNTADGQIKIRIARNQGTFNMGKTHFVADTDIEKINTVVRVRSENMAVQFAVEDGKKHRIRNYTLIYDQESLM